MRLQTRFYVSWACKHCVPLLLCIRGRVFSRCFQAMLWPKCAGRSANQCTPPNVFEVGNACAPTYQSIAWSCSSSFFTLYPDLRSVVETTNLCSRLAAIIIDPNVACFGRCFAHISYFKLVLVFAGIPPCFRDRPGGMRKPVLQSTCTISLRGGVHENGGTACM